MFAYLIDTETNDVILQVSGPLQVMPGQKVVYSQKEIPTKLASYDPTTDSIVRAPASQFAKLKRDARKDRKEVKANLERLSGELRGLVSTDPKLARVLEIVATLPPDYIRRVLSSVREDG